MNVVETFVEFPGIILKLFILSDPIFFNLLGALVVLAFLLFFVSLHHIMTRERSKKTRLATGPRKNDAPNTMFLSGRMSSITALYSPERINRAFIIYLNNWPDNYILPFHLRNYLEELKRDTTDSRHEGDANSINVEGKNLPTASAR